MQKILLVITYLISQISMAQNAVNFNCNDCSGENYNLFAELDAGKVVVICWVEPCGGCADAALLSSNLVESFNEDYPGMVSMYLVDDYADTDCESLIDWANMFGVHPTTFFSDASINMFDYGEPGMPKVIVVADADHLVFYNANFAVDPIELEEAISNAINATFTSFSENISDDFNLQVFPNPAREKVTVSFNLKIPSSIKAEILDQADRSIYLNIWNDLNKGPNEIEFSMPSIKDGIYFLKLSDGFNTSFKKLVFVH